VPLAEYDPTTVVGLREHLIAATRARLARLTNAECDWFDFTPDRHREQARLSRLLDGQSVLIYRHEIPAKYEPPRDGAIVWRLVGDRLVPGDHQPG
jgi:hypothetical protein